MPPKPAIPGGLLPTPPTTESTESRRNRSRRLQASSSTSNGDPMHIEPWRMGAPGQLPYLPLTKTAVSSNHPFRRQWNTIKDDIWRVLNSHNVEEPDVDVCMLVPQNKFDQVGSLTLRVITTKSETDDNWYLSVDSIRQILVEKGFGDVNVEFIDPRLLDRQVSRPIKEGEPIVQAWDRSICAAVLQAIDPLQWCSVSVLRRGPEDEYGGVPDDLPIVIIITIDIENKVGSWKDAEAEIYRACRAEHFSEQDLRVEFVYGQIWGVVNQGGRQRVPGQQFAGPVHITPAQAPDPELLQRRKMGVDEYQRAPGMGVSMGSERVDPKSNGPTGTLGGYVELMNDKGESKGVYGLTCHHVVRCGIDPEASEPGQEKGSTLRAFDNNGILPSDPKRLDMKMYQPALRDHNENMVWHQASMDDASSNSFTGPRQTRDAYNEEYNDFRVDKLNMERLWEELGKGFFGQVYASSGFPRRDPEYNSRLDWALVEVDTTKREVGRNILPDPKKTKGAHKPHKETANKLMTQIGNLRDPRSRVVYKKGRSTGQTAARLNFINDQVRLKEDKLGSYVTSSEYTYVNIDTRRGNEFSDIGDSGAMVYTDEGVWVGVLIAGNTKIANYYVTDAQVLIKNIEEVTGYKVRLPKPTKTKPDEAKPADTKPASSRPEK